MPEPLEQAEAIPQVKQDQAKSRPCPVRSILSPRASFSLCLCPASPSDRRAPEEAVSWGYRLTWAGIGFREPQIQQF